MKNSRKLIMSAAALALAVTSAGTATYAWFTATGEAKVAGFQLNVKTTADVDLAISYVNGSGYKNQLSVQDFADNYTASGKAAENFKFDATSTIDGKAFTTISVPTDLGPTDFITYPTITDTYAARIGKGLIDVDFFFQSNQALDVYVKTLTPTAANTSFFARFTAGASTNIVTAGNTETFNVINAARYAFVDTTAIADASKNDPTKGTLSYVYEPSYSTGTHNYGSFADPAAATTTNTAWDYMFKTLEARGHDTAVRAAFKPASLPTFTPQTAIDLGAAGIAGDTKLTTLVAHPTISNDYRGSVRVTIWIEGWDADCLNAILSAQLTTAFEFTAAKTV